MPQDNILPGYNYPYSEIYRSRIHEKKQWDRENSHSHNTEHPGLTGYNQQFPSAQTIRYLRYTPSIFTHKKWPDTSFYVSGHLCSDHLLLRDGQLFGLVRRSTKQTFDSTTKRICAIFDLAATAAGGTANSAHHTFAKVANALHQAVYIQAGNRLEH